MTQIIYLEFRRRSSLRRGEFDLDRDLDLDLRFLAFFASFLSFLAFLSALRRFFSNNSLICKSRIFLSFRIFQEFSLKIIGTNLLLKLCLLSKDVLEYILAGRLFLEFVELYR